MFFPVSKLFWFVGEPINFLVIIGLIGVILSLTPIRRFGRALAALSIVLLGIASFSPVGPVLLRVLENRFPLAAADIPAPTGIIVLGGAMDPDISQARGIPTLLQAGARLIVGAELARRFPKSRLIFTGGSADLTGKGLPEAPAARDTWMALGIPAEQITVESKSRNTWENGVFTEALVHPKAGETWLLVTSAWHMPRSMGIFRKVGFNVTAYPVDYRSFGDGRDFQMPHRALEALTMLDDAMHEWIGLVAYHLTGKTSAWFPAP